MLARWRRAGLIAPSIAALLMLAILIMLGTWQMSRKAWKEALIAQRAELALKLPIEPGSTIFNLNAVPEYTRVSLAGRFHHDKERYWFADGPEGAGFHVFTPLELGNGGIVWIDRGYVPARLRSASSRTAGQIDGNVTVAGRIRMPGERNRFTPDNDAPKNIWYWKDLEGMQTSVFPPQVRYAPVVVETEANQTPPGGWPKAGGQVIRLSNRHLEYALTWYGLAGSLIVVFFSFARGRLSRATE